MIMECKVNISDFKSRAISVTTNNTIRYSRLNKHRENVNEFKVKKKK